jgi:cytochrome c1
MVRGHAFGLLAALVLAGGCGGGEEEPAAGPMTTAATTTPEVDLRGQNLFLSRFCGRCHTFAPARSEGTVGPNLDDLPRLAAQADRGSLEEFVRESIAAPGAYVEPGFKNLMGKSETVQALTDDEIETLVNFITAAFEQA